MREAAVPGYRLSKARFSTKVLTTMGMLGLLLGIFGAVATTLLRTGITPNSVALYYGGSESVPEDEIGSIVAPEKGRSVTELSEITHMHLMGGSMMLFLLCHLLSVCDVGDRTRTSLYLASFASFIGTFALPWAIIFLSRAFSYLYLPVVATLIVSLIALCSIPIYEMWFRRASVTMEVIRKRAPEREDVRIRH